MVLRGLYAIADTGFLMAGGAPLQEFAESLQAAGVELIQLRDKSGSPRQVLAQGAVLRDVFAHGQGLLVMNDRADLALLAGFDGVHVGQQDLGVEDVRRALKARAGSAEREDELSSGLPKIVGVSTHTDLQVRQADLTSADYVAIGPVFATGTKLDASPVVGLEGVRRARGLTSKPLIAIGGIARENAASVLAAGADSVAVISGLLVAGESVEKVARDFLALFR